MAKSKAACKTLEAAVEGSLPLATRQNLIAKLAGHFAEVRDFIPINSLTCISCQEINMLVLLWRGVLQMRILSERYRHCFGKKIIKLTIIIGAHCFRVGVE